MLICLIVGKLRFNKYWPLLSFPSTDVTQVRGITNVCLRIKTKLVAFPCLIYNWSTAKWWPLSGQVHEYRHSPNKQVERIVRQSFSSLSNAHILEHQTLECGSISSRTTKSWLLSEIVDERSVHACCTTCMILSRVFPRSYMRVVDARTNSTCYFRPNLPYSCCGVLPCPVEHRHH